MEIYKAPNSYPIDKKFTIFLGGSIEQNKADKWQEDITKRLESWDIRILNPRRDDYDVTQEQSINNPYFKEQVDWELDGLDRSDLIVIYLQPGTYSPISLMEIGIYCNSYNIVVCCPDGFWRKGNVQIVCERYDIPLMESMEDLEEFIIEELESTTAGE